MRRLLSQSTISWVAQRLASRYPPVVSDASNSQSPAGGDIDEPVPKLPRGRGLKFSGPELFRIALTIIALIGVVVLTRPCANAVSGFVTSFDDGSNKAMPKPGTVDMPKEPQHYEQLKPGMTEAEIKAAMERSKAHNANSAGAAGGSAAPSASAPSGSAPSGSASGSTTSGSATSGSASGSATSSSATSGSASSDSATSGSATPR